MSRGVSRGLATLYRGAEGVAGVFASSVCRKCAECMCRVVWQVVPECARRTSGVPGCADSVPGCATAAGHGASTEPGIGRGLLRAKSPANFFSGATPTLNYRHLPPQLPASFEPLKLICGGTPDHAWNPSALASRT